MNNRICKKCPNGEGKWQWFRKPVAMNGEFIFMCYFYHKNANNPCFEISVEEMKTYPKGNLDKWVQENIDVEKLKKYCICYCEQLMDKWK